MLFPPHHLWILAVSITIYYCCLCSTLPQGKSLWFGTQAAFVLIYFFCHRHFHLSVCLHVVSTCLELHILDLVHNASERRQKYISHKDQSLLHFTCLMAGQSVNFSSREKIIKNSFFSLELPLWSPWLFCYYYTLSVSKYIYIYGKRCARKEDRGTRK